MSFTDFNSRYAAGNYLKHYGFHNVSDTSLWSNGKYYAYMLTNPYTKFDEAANKEVIAFKTRLQFFPINSLLTPVEVLQQIEENFYASKENEIKAG